MRVRDRAPSVKVARLIGSENVTVTEPTGEVLGLGVTWLMPLMVGGFSLIGA